MKHRLDDQEKSIAADTSGDGHQIEDVVADYLQQCESGSPPDRDEFIGKYPDLRDELIEFLENQKEFSKLASPIREMQSAMSSWEQPESGKTVGDYEIIEEIGRGGMGVIYRARQISLQRIVALKMIHRGRLGSSNDVTRFYREAEAAAALDHPNIVPIIEVGEQDDHHFFAMKLAEGGSFEEAIKSGLTLRPSVHIVVQVARAIHHAHSKGILHRDLKPSNILIDTPAGDTQELDDTHPNVSRTEFQGSRSNNEETIKALVTDFGLAKIQKLDGGLTATGTILGSPNYMSPEQANAGSDSELTPATDVHGLGSVLYFALVGLPPFRGADLVDVLNQVRDADPVPPRTLNPVVDRDLETICLKCLEKSPSRRYESAMAVADDLDRYLDGRPIEARAAGFVERSVKWARREPKLSALAAVSALLILATIGGLFAINMLTDREKKKTEAALTQVTDEKTETQKALWRSFVSEARAHRWSGRQGYRFKAIESLENAIRLHPEIEAGPDQIRLVQNELVAALAVQFDATTAELHPLRVHNTEPFSFDFDPKLQNYALGHDDGAVSVYSMESRRLVAEVPPSPTQARIRNVRFDKSGSVLAVADEDGILSLYRFDHHSLSPIWTSQCYPFAFDFCPKSNVVVVADRSRIVQFYNYETGEAESQFNLESDVRWLRTNSDGTRLVVADYRVARVLEADSGKELVTYKNPSGITAAIFTEGGRQLVVAHQKNAVRVIDVDTGFASSTFVTRGSPINLVSIPGSACLLVCESDGQTRVWKQGKSSSILAIKGFARRFDSESDKVGFRSDSSIGQWIVAQSQTLVLPTHEFWLREAHDIAFSPNLGLCATSEQYGIQFWRTDTFEKLGELPLVRTTCVAFDPIDGSLVSAGNLGLIRWPIRLVGNKTLQIGKPQPFELQNQLFRPKLLAFSNDGSVLACSCDLDRIRTILVFPAGQTQPKWKLGNESGEFNSLDVSQDGKFIAASTWNDETVYVWNTHTGTLEAEIESSDRATTRFNAANDLIVSDVAFGTRRFQSGTWQGLGQISPDGWAQIDSPTANQLYGVADHAGDYELLRYDFNRPLIELAYGEPGRRNGRIKFSHCGTLFGAARDVDGFQIWNVANIHAELERRGIGWDAELQFNEPIKLPEKLELEFVFSDHLKADGNTFAVKFPSEPTTPRSQRIWLESADGQQTRQFSNAVFFRNGERKCAGIPFQVTPDFVIASRYSESQFSPAVGGILIGRKCRRLFFLHGVFELGGNHHHQQIGKIEIVYEDGTSEEKPIRRQVEFPDWRVQHLFDTALDPIGDIVRTVTGLPCVARVNSWTNPHPQKMIREVRLIAENPLDAPFLLAITGEE